MTNDALRMTQDMTHERPGNIVLAGFMGTGKTTVGLLVAERLGWPFVDTDALVEQETGMTVREIFAAQGERTFREMERQACLKASEMSKVVISVGGGAVQNPENRRVLEASGVMLLLTCERDKLIERLEESARQGERPLLGNDIGGHIDALTASRAGVYATIERKIDTTHLTPDEVASLVVSVISEMRRRTTDG